MKRYLIMAMNLGILIKRNFLQVPSDTRGVTAL